MHYGSTLFLLFFSTIALAELSADSFFDYPEADAIKISPNGETVAILATTPKGTQLLHKSIASDSPQVLMDLSQYSDQEMELSNYTWIDNRFIAARVSEEKLGVGDLLDTKRNSRLLIIDSQTDIKTDAFVGVRTKGWFAHPLKNEPGKFLYGKSSRRSKLYKLDVNLLQPDKKKLGKLDKIDGGQFSRSNVVVEVEGYAINWFFDAKGEPKSALYWGKENKLYLVNMSEDGEPSIIKAWAKEEINPKNNTDEEKAKKLFFPTERTDSENIFYAIDLAQERPTKLYRVNFETNESELIYTTRAYKILEAIIDENAELHSVEVIKNGKRTIEFTNGDSVERTKLKTTISRSLDGNVAIQYYESHNQPGRFMLVKNSKESLIAKNNPVSLPLSLATEQVTGRIEHAGQPIDYLLNFPNNGNSAKYPLIVMPHGGPIGVYDTPFYDPATQFFSNNGYAVLRVNFRGSGGYSDAFEEAATNHWHDLIIEDIYLATEAALQHSKIDPTSVCSFGASFGGYAALMLALDYPDVFKCAGSLAGVTDLNLYRHSPYANHRQREWINEQLGSKELKGDSLYDLLKSRSPIFLAEKFTQPLLIMHGEKDKVVSVEHAYRMKLLLEKDNIAFDWYIDEESGHHFNGEGATAAAFDRALKFISNNIR